MSGAAMMTRCAAGELADLAQANLDGMAKCIDSAVILPSGARCVDGVTAPARRSRLC
jgi:hypothetical protein